MRRLLRQITVQPHPCNRPPVAAVAARKSLIAQSNPIVKACLGIMGASRRQPLMAALFGRAPNFFADNDDAGSLLPVARGVGQQASARANHAVCWKFPSGMGLFCPTAPLQAHAARRGCRGCHRRIGRRGRRHLAAQPVANQQSVRSRICTDKRNLGHCFAGGDRHQRNGGRTRYRIASAGVAVVRYRQIDRNRPGRRCRDAAPDRCGEPGAGCGWGEKAPDQAAPGAVGEQCPEIRAPRACIDASLSTSTSFQIRAVEPLLLCVDHAADSA